MSWSCRRCSNLCDHPTAEEIYDAAVKECPGLSLGTVYRNLNSLVDAGRVRRVSIPGKADRFDHTLPWHSHLYCTVCGSVTDAEVDEKQVMKLVKNQKGYGAGLRRGAARRVRRVLPREAGRRRPQRLNRHKICMEPLARSGQTGYTIEKCSFTE